MSQTMIKLLFQSSTPLSVEDFCSYLELLSRLYSASTAITRRKQIDLRTAKRELIVHPMRTASKIIGISAHPEDIQNSVKALKRIQSDKTATTAQKATSVAKDALLEDYKGKKIDITLDLTGLEKVISEIKNPDVQIKIVKSPKTADDTGKRVDLTI
jgi:hypothetical protein